MVEFIVAVMTHEDMRFYTLGHSGFLERTGYALSRAVFTRSDSGNQVFSVTEVVDAGASAGISSLDYPSRECSISNTGTEWDWTLAPMRSPFWPRSSGRTSTTTFFRAPKNPTMLQK
jgi:hypothetical protein